MELFQAIIETGAGVVVLYTALILGRAVNARIAGPYAETVLNAPLLAMLIPLPRRVNAPQIDEYSVETGNTETPDNTGKQQETPALMTSSGYVTGPVLLKQTREEHEELIRVRHEAIGLLNKCVTYYRDSGMADDGTIPRYDKLKMNAKDRGVIVDNLWYSTCVVKTQNRTYTDPAYYKTCAELMQSIISNKTKVYPVGYAERQQELLDSAVNALPLASR